VAAENAIELEVVDAAGKKKAARSVNAAFGVEPRGDVLHQVVRLQRAAKRAGSHKTKTRTEVSGGGAKPWRQKGTGRARAGSSRSPLWVGGGVAHGPKPRSYEFSLNKKQKRLALASAISAKRSAGTLKVVESISLKEISTKAAQAMLGKIGVPAGASVLLVLAEDDHNTVLSMRNIAGVDVCSANGLNVYDILNHEHLLIADEVLEAVEARLS